MDEDSFRELWGTFDPAPPDGASGFVDKLSDEIISGDSSPEDKTRHVRSLSNLSGFLFMFASHQAGLELLRVLLLLQ